ncbi:hypothetical protein DL764_000443 [Monosporascus ibericus]|uniref:HNH nuclease domain-containing protein n=1 Tax=Monosporascus ibericus TaxID=155417 RepID=A0A4Q4TTP6_9PEZI|nr:hypothetical protein DL764_000443 [Monosporascus ibericus]
MNWRGIHKFNGTSFSATVKFFLFAIYLGTNRAVHQQNEGVVAPTWTRGDPTQNVEYGTDLTKNLECGTDLTKKLECTMGTVDLETQKLLLGLEAKQKRKLLKPKSSFDSEYWSNTAQYYDMKIEQNECATILAFRSEASGGHGLSLEEWQGSATTGMELARQRAAMELMKSMAEEQAASLEVSEKHPGMQSFFKLFFGARSGFHIGGASAGERDSSAQSNMRTALVQKYNNGRPEELGIWEPVIGAYLPGRNIKAAHLYPWRSHEHMDTIFGQGSTKDLMTPYNGLLLDSSIEALLERGYIAIVPDIELEPLDTANPRADGNERRQRVKEWESRFPRDYKVLILDRGGSFTKYMTEICQFRHLYGITSPEDLHGRRLKFLNEFRPKARYIWWTYLNAIAQVSFRYKHETEAPLQKEVMNANRYWGGAGSYVGKAVLSGFVKHIGQRYEDVRDAFLDPDSAKDDDVSDITAAAVVTQDTYRKSSRRIEKGDWDDWNDGEGNEDGAILEDEESDSEDEEVFYKLK